MRAKPARVTEIAAETIDARLLLKVLSDFKKGDFTSRLPSEQTGLTGKIYDALNEVTELNERMAKEFDRVATVVGNEGKLGGQAQVKGVAGTWKDLTDNVNFMASNLTNQVRNIAEVTTAVARGDLSKKITVDVKGEILELKNTINTMVDQLSTFAS